VDYEMAGKDLIDSVQQSSKIARVLGARPPEGFNYEMFLDEKGEKISKSKGNGLSIDQWLTYGPEESLAYYIYREPKRAKSLHMGVIPRAVDDYWQSRAAWFDQPLPQRLGNAVHHVHDGAVPAEGLPVSFGLLLNLVGVLGESASREQVWGYLANYVPDARAETYPELDRLIGHALAYHRDFVAPTLARRAPDEREAAALADLDRRLAVLDDAADAETIQNQVYEAGIEPRPADGQLHRALRHPRRPPADRRGAGLTKSPPASGRGEVRQKKKRLWTVITRPVRTFTSSTSLP
jgi:lysyl-tRNA synthetase class 1